MSKKSIPSVSNDFDGAMAFLATRGIVPASPGNEITIHARRLHRSTYSLILWKFRLKGLPEHGAVFLEEIASDAIQILPQVLSGYGKTVNLLTRGIIENTFRLLYFSDHPIEFERTNREKKWYPVLDELFGYPRIHPTLLKTEKSFDAGNQLKTLYDELSASIHGRRVEDLEMRRSLNKIVYDNSACGKHVARVEKCAAAANFLLVSFHRDKFRQLQQEDRQIILSTMSTTARQTIAGLR